MTPTTNDTTQTLIILGSTGSIGVNALSVAKSFEIKIESLSAGRNIALLNTQIKEYTPQKICIADPNDKDKLDTTLIKQHNIEVFYGASGIIEMIESSQSNLVLNAIVGFAGLAPSLKTKQCGKNLALANKESLVSGGWLFGDYSITPIDSEHFGLSYLLRDKDSQMLKRLIITASGGALRNMPITEIPNASLQSALKHPNWKMGQKITIDSATMANKLFEVLETFWLFGVREIDAYIEQSSLIHALVEFIDGSLSAHLSVADMKLPIAYALDSTKARNLGLIASFDMTKFCNIALKEIDTARYPLWSLKDELLSSPKLGIVLNASNEIAVNAFLQEKITFDKITTIIESALQKFSNVSSLGLMSYEDIACVDNEVRQYTQNLI